MSLYEELGGEPAVGKVVDQFYNKVLQDPAINSFFKHLDMDRQKKMMKQFLTLAFGGNSQYSGRGMRAAHRRPVEQGLNENHFDRVIKHLGDTLQELGVAPEKIEQAASIANSVRSDVLQL